MARPPFMDPNFLVIELIFSAIVILLALLIYFRTKEMYALTKHRGINYFRNAFLFFGLAYFFRFVFHLFRISRFLFDINISRQIIAPASLVLTSYLSTMAIFFLVLSTLWKKTKDKPLLQVAQGIAIIIAVLVAVFRTPEILTIAQLILLVFAVIMSYFSYKKSKKHSRLFIIYILLFIIWIFNISVLGPIWFLPFGLRMLSPLISIILFAIIYFRVSKWTK
ncbi:hypothetical protein AYK26_02485 [Euryarchaeota archaeon SM23-78]|nr:MAG: hypothetical protein AYK26_02485 [Euryarchaeota archaeon SM23-78]MBW3000240.1 hypothetical protein [Candidatus Woesearchaeota archaeon]